MIYVMILFLIILRFSLTLHKKMKFSADLVTFTGEILNGKLHFLSSGNFFHLAEYVLKIEAKYLLII